MRVHHSFFSTSAAIALALSTAMFATSERADAAGLLIADGGFGGVLEIKDHAVDVTINNGIAVTNVEQIFVNTENRVVEALFTFPVPKKASVANFSMWINGKEMIGEVVEKERAREIYESYKATRKDPGLLEQVDFKRFEMRIFPIAAGAEQRVRISYYQELDFDHDWANYVYPLATTTQVKADNASANFSFRVDVKSEVPVVEMESPSHPDAMAVTPFGETLYRASLETAQAQLDEDVVVAYRVKRPVTGLDVVANKSAGADGFFQTTLTVGDELATVEKGMDYVFVLDISGSMRNNEKLRVSQSSIYAFVENLSPEDRFEIVTFNDRPEMRFEELVAATTDNHNRAKDILATLQARGGTSLRPAVQAAYRYADADRPLNVVVLSDGLTEAGDGDELVQTIRSRPESCRVFAIGVGNDVNRPLLRSMAQRAGGLASFISQGDNFDRQAAAFRRKLTRPAIENVKIAFDGSVYDVEPLERANIYHGSPLRLYGRYRDAGTVNVTLTGTIMGAPFEKLAEIELPSSEDSNPEIERMWASYRVDRMLPEAKRSGGNGGNGGNAKNEVVTLCEQFSIVSEFASFIVLENDAEYRRWNIERRNLSRSSRDRVAQQRVNEQLKRLREQAMANLGPARPVEPGDRRLEKPTRKQIASSNPTPANRPAVRPSAPIRNRGFDLDFGGGGGGGGAFDPITGLLALGLGGLGWARRRVKE